MISPPQRSLNVGLLAIKKPLFEIENNGAFNSRSIIQQPGLQRLPSSPSNCNLGSQVKQELKQARKLQRIAKRQRRTQALQEKHSTLTQISAESIESEKESINTEIKDTAILAETEIQKWKLDLERASKITPIQHPQSNQMAEIIEIEKYFEALMLNSMTGFQLTANIFSEDEEFQSFSFSSDEEESIAEVAPKIKEPVSLLKESEQHKVVSQTVSSLDEMRATGNFNIFGLSDSDTSDVELLEDSGQEEDIDF